MTKYENDDLFERKKNFHLRNVALFDVEIRKIDYEARISVS